MEKNMMEEDRKCCCNDYDSCNYCRQRRIKLFGGIPCGCGRDEGDSVDNCEQCKQYSCGRQCQGTPSLVYTDEGWYCAKCLRDRETILIMTKRAPKYGVDGSGSDFESGCEKCGTENEAFKLADHILCSNCLQEIIKATLV
jgi:hypothetical protein